MMAAESRASDLSAILAHFLLTITVGERLPTVRTLARRYDVSVGSVHGALTGLEDQGAVGIERRGHLGAFLIAKSAQRLWSFAERGPLVIALPLARTGRYEGLATALKAQIRALGIESFLIFVAGSRHRLQALRNGSCAVAVMSALAADEVGTPAETKLQTLPPGSYVSEHRVYRRKATSAHRKLRAVIDERSVDQQLLSRLEFEGQPVEYVSASYMQFGRLFEEGSANVAVWSADEAPRGLDTLLESSPVADRVLNRIQHRDTQACLVGRNDDSPGASVAAEAFDPERLLAIQADVMSGRRIPEY